MPIKCPCHSQKSYESCCKAFHDGTRAPNALLLMRSRYAAYALKLADYIIATTHRDNPLYKENIPDWKKDIVAFGDKTTFTGLDIIEFIDGENNAFVTFRAGLHQGETDVSFTEKSAFIKENSRWFYANALEHKH